jgi:Protein of unknown function (DUF3443)/Abnormal spindle-like microcephaly-assoc'd, ASPM-SPD-2-Hydin
MKSLIKGLSLALLGGLLLSGCGSSGSSSPTLAVATSLSFGSQTVGSPSTKALTVTNTGTATLVISSVTVTGVSFTQENACTNVAPGATCTINVTYTPPDATAQTGSLSIVSNAPHSPATVSLSGAAGLTNFLPVSVSVGPLPDSYSVNVLYTTITLCTHGSTTACSTIPNIQVDTGSVGLRLISPLPTGSAVPTPIIDPTTTSPIFECVQFVDGYTWGSMVTFDIQFGGQTLSNVAVNLMGDAAAGTAPDDCGTPPAGSTLTAGPGYPNESTLAILGVNGILGVGNFLQDCETFCTPSYLANHSQYLSDSPYYVCPTTCVHTGVATQSQANNLVALLDTDNNGLLVDLPSALAAGQESLDGKIYFGVNTQANNQIPSSAKTYSLSYYGTLSTTYSSAVLPYSFIDSGSNGLYFNDLLIDQCADLAYQFYCPASTLDLSAVIQNSDATVTSDTIHFSIGNADRLLPISTPTPLTVLPTLGGPLSQTASFDWGLPFFYGRKVFVLLDSNAGYANGAIAF